MLNIKITAVKSVLSEDVLLFGLTQTSRRLLQFTTCVKTNVEETFE